jgi:hypothetical protein
MSEGGSAVGESSGCDFVLQDTRSSSVFIPCALRLHVPSRSASYLFGWKVRLRRGSPSQQYEVEYRGLPPPAALGITHCGQGNGPK